MRKPRSTSHGGTPCSRQFLKPALYEGKQSGAYFAEVEEAPDERDEGVPVLEASDDELEAECQKAVL